jgi:hypothetical protein
MTEAALIAGEPQLLPAGHEVVPRDVEDAEKREVQAADAGGRVERLGAARAEDELPVPFGGVDAVTDEERERRRHGRKRSTAVRGDAGPLPR